MIDILDVISSACWLALILALALVVHATMPSAFVPLLVFTTAVGAVMLVVRLLDQQS